MDLLSRVWLLHVTCAAANIAMATYLFARAPRARLTWTCAAITLCFAYWSACLSVSHHPAVSRETAALFYDIGSFGWAGFASFAALFIVTFLRPELVQRKWFVPALVVPPAIVIWAQWTGRLAADYVARPWGYAYVWQESFWTYFFYTYYWLYMGLGLTLLLRASYKTEDSVVRRQARIISATAWVPLLFSSLTDVLLPKLGIFSVPNMAPDFIVIWVAGLVYAMVEYRMLELTPRFAADEIVANMSDGLLLLDPSRRIVRVNRSATSLLGWSEKELLRRELGSLFPPSKLESIECLLDEKPTARHDLCMLKKDGSEVEVILSSSELLGTADELVGTVCIVTDNTVHKQREAHLEKRVTERTRALKRSQAELAQSDRLASLGFLVAGMGHEINNPLSYVLLNLEELAQDPTLATARPRIEEALQGARRVRDVVKDLRTFSRVDERDVQAVAPNDVITSALRLANKQLEFRATVETELGEVPMVMVNESQLTQVLVNLLVNAAHAIDEGKPEENRICVRSRSTGNEVEIEVSDTGRGIAPENLDRLFDPFFSTKAVSDGLGLGLAICHRLVSAVGGRIEVKSTLGKGSSFLVKLPAHADAKPAPPKKVEPLPVPTTARVLIVDDEPAVRRVLGRLLQKNCEVVGVGSGEEALELLGKDDGFDVVLCDLMMPTMSGMDFADRLEESGSAMAKRVVFMTGGAFTPRANEFLSKTRFPALHKPFDPGLVLGAIQSVVKEEGRRNQPAR
jgi:PAS domain S-box-containing protein